MGRRKTNLVEEDESTGRQEDRAISSQYVADSTGRQGDESPGGRAAGRCRKMSQSDLVARRRKTDRRQGDRSPAGVGDRAATQGKATQGKASQARLNPQSLFSSALIPCGEEEREREKTDDG